MNDTRNLKGSMINLFKRPRKIYSMEELLISEIERIGKKY